MQSQHNLQSDIRSIEALNNGDHRHSTALNYLSSARFCGETGVSFCWVTGN